jgi:carbamoyltransferase
VLDEEGNLRFAEATERFLQDKRAWGAAPDHPGHLSRALGLSDVDADETVVATSWARRKSDVPLAYADLFLTGRDARWMASLQARAHDAAGASVERVLGAVHRREIEHHLCHAAFACWTSPFAQATCLVLDGEGDVGAASAYAFREGRLRRLWRSWGPGSLGAYYSWLTDLCGFDWKAGEEWKVMGLAAFGAPDPEMCELLSRVLRVEDGKPVLTSPGAVEDTTAALEAWRRAPDSPPLLAAGLAASGQAVFTRWADAIVAQCPRSNGNLVLAGGCALNSSYNGFLLGSHAIDAVHVPCAPADDGNAVGAALIAWMEDHPGQRPGLAAGPGHASPFLGGAPDRRAVERAAHLWSGGPVVPTRGDARVLAAQLAHGKIIGVMHGAAEFGPRALGHRSILADPRAQGMKDRLNRDVKGREPYRPFAPMLPLEHVDEWFQRAQPSPYMSFALPWRTRVRDAVPAVVHQDGTGRLQTVDGSYDGWHAALLRAFEAHSGIPILLNTSFNIMGKPIVDSVEDAMGVLTTTGLDGVMLDDILLMKEVA